MRLLQKFCQNILAWGQVVFLCFVCLFWALFFWDHTQESFLNWVRGGDHMRCWRSNTGRPQARQASYILYYLSGLYSWNKYFLSLCLFEYVNKNYFSLLIKSTAWSRVGLFTQKIRWIEIWSQYDSVIKSSLSKLITEFLRIIINAKLSGPLCRLMLLTGIASNFICCCCKLHVFIISQMCMLFICVFMHLFIY